jgi:hypothetical protein
MKRTTHPMRAQTQPSPTTREKKKRNDGQLQVFVGGR